MPTLGYSALMPPTILIVLCVLGSVAALRYRRSGLAVAIAASVLLYLSATPLVATGLSRYLTVRPADAATLRQAQAIVVLGGGMHIGDGAPDTLDGVTLERLAAAARLWRLTELPVAVTGGRPPRAASSLGALMKTELEENFHVPVNWAEGESRTTIENATFTAPLLKQAGVREVIVVTSPWHMKRALWSFEDAGLKAVAYPTVPEPRLPTDAGAFFPDTGALHHSFYDLHEIIGLFYYRLAHPAGD